jgi:hypothetical protein
MDPGILLGVFIAWPWLAFVPAVVFIALYVRRRRRLLLVTALAWLAYGAWEYGMKLRLLCSGECNIRVDLLLLYPLLLMLTLAGLVVALRRSPPPR